MRILKQIRELLTSKIRDSKPSPEQETEMRRVVRRLRKFPRLKGCPNPHAHRTDLMKYRRGIE